MDRKQLTEKARLVQRMQQEPYDYKCCVNEACTCKQECLHYLAYQKSGGFFLKVLNPRRIACHGTGGCDFFADATRSATYALGFSLFVSRLNKDEKERFQRRCMQAFCKSVYYEMRAGKRIIMPWEQDILLEAARREGIEVEGQLFDETFEAPRW